MKLMTLNTHSLAEGNGEAQIAALANFLRRERPDGVALQEVCQSRSAPETDLPHGGTVLERGIPLRRDNFLLRLHGELSDLYSFCWLPVKIGYGVRDEGLGFLCGNPVVLAEEIELTPCRSYEDWRRRSALRVRMEGRSDTLICLHTDWWEEGFLSEWERICAACGEREPLWLMGDFNVSTERLLREGDPLRAAGFWDSYSLARERDLGDTVLPQADGWWGRERRDGLRIDQIRCRPRTPILRYRRVLDGREDPMVSDHFGVMIETEEETV